jgi:glycosyltransferase involved in cell wall biosynthesis
MGPLVSVICVCYNHEQFVREALESVKAQTYPNIELIIVDDGSADQSASIIKDWLSQNSIKQFIHLPTNSGYCRAFNQGLAFATGDYTIDLATDDIMMPEKIERQVNHFSSLDENYGVTFTDAVYVDKNGKYLRDHFDHLLKKKLIHHIPEGDVYRDVLSTYFIASPTMMIRTKVLRELGGYDERLAYEDFDFWVRSARHFKYSFLNEKLIKIRRQTQSMSSGWYQPGDPQLHSTYQVCRKAMAFNRDQADWNAWIKRVKYELRQSVFSQNHQEAKLFFDLLREANHVDGWDKLVHWMDAFHLPLASLRTWYHRVKYDS